MKHQCMQEVLEFIQKSPSTFHAVNELKNKCINAGFCELKEGNRWTLNKGGHYVVTRNNSSIIAFTIGNDLNKLGFNIVASHSDSPTFKIKEHAEIATSNYLQLNTEGYGGMIASSWFDCPLSLAGRVVVKDTNGLSIRLYDANRDLLMIPNVAIHMNRNVNSGYNYNLQVDLLPLLGSGEKGTLKKIVAHDLGVEESAVLSMELNL